MALTIGFQYVITYDGAGNFKSYVNGPLVGTATRSKHGALPLYQCRPHCFWRLTFHDGSK